MPHATHATIHLDALRHNLLAVRQLAGARAILVPVKADAYGHGAVAVSQFVERDGLADWLGVATAPEAIELRDAGCCLPILKMSLSFAEELPSLLACPNIALTVADARTVDEAEAAAAAAGVVANVHLAVDTGMRRIGCEPSSAVAIARHIDACRHLNLQGIGTHLPISDVLDDSGFTNQEMAVFGGVAKEIEDARSKPVPLVHCANSGALLGHSLADDTMVRPGIMVYGYYPDATTPRPVDLEPVMTLTTRLTFIKPVAAGETVGYGRTYTVPRDTWIATVPVGYADGFSRLNSNRGAMLVNGVRCPVVGRVCMDFTMLDLGPAATAPALVGDAAIWLGRAGANQITADDLAGIMGTISYEVLCLVSGRVPREYVDA